MGDTMKVKITKDIREEKMFDIYVSVSVDKLNNSEIKPFVLKKAWGSFVEEEIGVEEIERVIKYFRRNHNKQSRAIDDYLKRQKKEGNKLHINCGFPFDCHDFPCKELRCHGDCCDNGRVYKQS